MSRQAISMEPLPSADTHAVSRRIDTLIVGFRGAQSAAMDSALTGLCNVRRISSLIKASGDEIFDLLIVDGSSNNLEVFEIVRLAASSYASPYIIARAGTDEEVDRILALEAGADECVAHSCGNQEIKARIRAFLRRQVPIVKPVFNTTQTHSSTVDGSTPGSWVFDQLRSQLYAPNGQVIELTSVEHAILHELVRDAGSVKTRATLMDISGCGGKNAVGRTLDVNIARLRRKISGVYNEKIVLTVYGVGYKVSRNKITMS